MAQVLDGWIAGTGWMPKLHSLSETQWFCADLIGTCDVWVIRAPDVCGFLARDAEEVPALYLGHAARGQGFGKALLDRARDRRDQLALWTFQANIRAVAFYRREGFVEAVRTTGDGNAEKLPDIRLIWTRKPTP